MGNSYGYAGLGKLYADGLGVEQDYEKAAEYYRKAIDMDGNEDAAEQLNKQIGRAHV